MKNSDELKQIVLAKSAGYVNFLANNRYYLSDSDPRLHIEVVDRGGVGLQKWKTVYEIVYEIS